MAFWQIKESRSEVAVIDARTGRERSLAELAEDTARIQAALLNCGRKTLGLVIAQNRYECLATYLAALNSNTALILLDRAVNPALLREFVAKYRPDWIHCAGDLEFPGYKPSKEPGMLENEKPEAVEIHPDLALLLSTSGSTGSPKLVRLTRNNLDANAAAIAEYLQLTPQDRPITSLPMSYSYGLSVINSHLHAGATIVLTDDGVLRREFWDAVDKYGCTSLAGVPHTYRMLWQTGLLNKRGSSLKKLTQAGGRLDEELIREMHKLALARGWKFLVMYGQTEATARISYVPFEQLGRKIGSVGIAIPGGSMSADESTGELVYRGPNVMLGYAECREDLSQGDELNGVLRTGDLAWQDSDGYFYITGRLKRFVKMFGKRFNLDEVERILSQHFGAPVACYGQDDSVAAAVERCDNPDALRTLACEIFDLPRTALRVVAVNDLPRTANGKLDYQRLADASCAHVAVAAR
jgi:acyl-coenzyme A synthetase/AMP-(fatty) acid ligase